MYFCYIKILYKILNALNDCMSCHTFIYCDDSFHRCIKSRTKKEVHAFCSMRFYTLYRFLLFSHVFSFVFICHKRNKLLLHIPFSHCCGYRCHVFIIMWIVSIMSAFSTLSLCSFNSLLPFDRILRVCLCVCVFVHIYSPPPIWSSSFIFCRLVFVVDVLKFTFCCLCQLISTMKLYVESILFIKTKLCEFFFSLASNTHTLIYNEQIDFSRVTLMHSSFCLFFFLSSLLSLPHSILSKEVNILHCFSWRWKFTLTSTDTLKYMHECAVGCLHSCVFFSLLSSEVPT